MSYTPPASNAVNFLTVREAYTPPAGNAANFLTYEEGVVTAAGSGSYTLSGYGGLAAVLATADGSGTYSATGHARGVWYEEAEGSGWYSPTGHGLCLTSTLMDGAGRYEVSGEAFGNLPAMASGFGEVVFGGGGTVVVIAVTYYRSASGYGKFSASGQGFAIGSPTSALGAGSYRVSGGAHASRGVSASGSGKYTWRSGGARGETWRSSTGGGCFSVGGFATACHGVSALGSGGFRPSGAALGFYRDYPMGDGSGRYSPRGLGTSIFGNDNYTVSEMVASVKLESLYATHKEHCLVVRG